MPYYFLLILKFRVSLSSYFKYTTKSYFVNNDLSSEFQILYKFFLWHKSYDYTSACLQFIFLFMCNFIFYQTYIPFHNMLSNKFLSILKSTDISDLQEYTDHQKHQVPYRLQHPESLFRIYHILLCS